MICARSAAERVYKAGGRVVIDRRWINRPNAGLEVAERAKIYVGSDKPYRSK